MQSARLTDDEVIEKARWIWENGTLHKTAHFGVEMKNAGATMVDAENAFFGDCRVRKAEWNEEHRQWRYTILGRDADGCELSLVIAIDVKNSTLILVTTF